MAERGCQAGFRARASIMGDDAKYGKRCSSPSCHALLWAPRCGEARHPRPIEDHVPLGRHHGAPRPPLASVPHVQTLAVLKAVHTPPGCNQASARWIQAMPTQTRAAPRYWMGARCSLKISHPRKEAVTTSQVAMMLAWLAGRSRRPRV